MSLEKIAIGVDLDGVCADYFARMREIAAEWLERDISELTTEVTCSFPEWGIKDMEQYLSLYHFAVTKRNLFSTCKMLPHACTYLRLLSGEGAKIILYRFVTHNFLQKVLIQTVDWLSKNRIPYGELCFIKVKEKVEADIYIEDSPTNIVELRKENLYTICFANSKNKDVEQPRVGTWEEVYQLIKKKYDSNT